MKLIKIAFLFLILITNSYLCNAFEVIEGEIIEITGPDDMDLDPQNAIIAVDSYGNGDSIVNDVEFFTDRDGLGGQTVGEGMVEKGRSKHHHHNYTFYRQLVQRCQWPRFYRWGR